VFLDHGFISTAKASVIGIGIAIELGIDNSGKTDRGTDPDCDSDSDPERNNAVSAALSSSKNNATVKTGGYFTHP
jgi:hypothetical protein